MQSAKFLIRLSVNIKQNRFEFASKLTMVYVRFGLLITTYCNVFFSEEAISKKTGVLELFHGLKRTSFEVDLMYVHKKADCQYVIAYVTQCEDKNLLRGPSVGFEPVRHFLNQTKN